MSKKKSDTAPGLLDDPAEATPPAPEDPRPDATGPTKPADAKAADPDEAAFAIEWKAEVEKREQEVGEFERDYLNKKEEASKAKKSFEAADAELREFIRQKPKPMPLFDAKLKPKAAPTPNGVPRPEPDSDDSAGLAEPVSRLPIADGIAKKLAAAGLKTVGAIATWTARGRKLAEIAGLGKSSAEALEAALAGFWEARRRDAIEKTPRTGLEAADATTGQPGAFPDVAKSPEPTPNPKAPAPAARA